MSLERPVTKVQYKIFIILASERKSHDKIQCFGSRPKCNVDGLPGHRLHSD